MQEKAAGLYSNRQRRSIRVGVCREPRKCGRPRGAAQAAREAVPTHRRCMLPVANQITGSYLPVERWLGWSLSAATGAVSWFMIQRSMSDSMLVVSSSPQGYCRKSTDIPAV